MKGKIKILRILFVTFADFVGTDDSTYIYFQYFIPLTSILDGR